MNASEIIQILLAVSGSLLAFHVSQVNKRLDKITDFFGELTRAVSMLSSQIAVVIERVDSHERRINRLEE